MRYCFFFLLLLVVIGSGCTNNALIVNGIEEREANEIVVFLSNKGIRAEKVSAKTSGGIGESSGGALYSISVDVKQITEAMSILNQNGLPRKKGAGLLELFAKQGLMSTEKEEGIRYQAGLAQQVANTIRKIDGVIEAEVQIAFPKETSDISGYSTAPQKITAAVYVKHQGVGDDPNKHLTSKIRRLVAASISGLDINDVTVILDLAVFSLPETDLEVFSHPNPKKVLIWSIAVDADSVVRFRLLFLSLILTNLVQLVALSWIAWKIYPWIKEKGGIKELFTFSPTNKTAPTVSTPTPSTNENQP